MKLSNSIRLLSITMILGVVSTVICLGQGSDQVQENGIRVGIYDSRSVAVAYARSPMFNASMLEIKAEYNEAEKEGNKDRMDEIGEQMQAQQELFHKQAFSIWPVNDILAKIQDELPAIAEEAGVDILVSKWDIAYQNEGLQFVDVSAMIVRPFDPDEATLKILSQVKDNDPVPLEELTHEH